MADGLMPRSVSQVLSYYSQPVFSVDLVTAARRQSLFIEDLEQLGWLESSFFDGDSSVLEMAVARYHQYLDASHSSLPKVYTD